MSLRLIIVLGFHRAMRTFKANMDRYANQPPLPEPVTVDLGAYPAGHGTWTDYNDPSAAEPATTVQTMQGWTSMEPLCVDAPSVNVYFLILVLAVTFIVSRILDVWEKSKDGLERQEPKP